jgi:alpha-mannosidase
VQTNYALVPHAEDWKKAGLWRETAEWSEPLLAQLGSSARPASAPLVAIEDPGVQLSAMFVEGRDLIVRLFNAESEAEDHTVRFGVKPGAIDLVELDGRRAASAQIIERSAEACRVRIGIPPFGLRTIRLREVAAQASTGRERR